MIDLLVEVLKLKGDVLVVAPFDVAASLRASLRASLPHDQQRRIRVVSTWAGMLGCSVDVVIVVRPADSNIVQEAHYRVARRDGRVVFFDTPTSP